MPDQAAIPSNEDTIQQFDGNPIVLSICSWDFAFHVRKNKIPTTSGARMVFSPDRKPLTGIIDIQHIETARKLLNKILRPRQDVQSILDRAEK
jgi:hypothetical protein